MKVRARRREHSFYVAVFADSILFYLDIAWLCDVLRLVLGKRRHRIVFFLSVLTRGITITAACFFEVVCFHIRAFIL